MSRNPATDVLSHNALLILISCGLLYFITLGAREVQPFEESMNATRARGVIEQNAWMDQTQVALGGLHSSARAPFPVWAMAFFMKPMKMTPMSVRLFSTLCGIASLFLMYSIACFLLPRKTAILAAVFLCASLGWNHYSRLGTSDIPFLCATLLALFAMLHALHAEARSKQLAYVSLYALALALAFSSSLFASIIPLGFILLLFVQKRAERLSNDSEVAGQSSGAYAALHNFASHAPQNAELLRMPILLATLVGLLLGTSWYLRMSLIHGTAVWSALSQSLPSLQASGLWLGPLSVLNTLVISQPISLLALVWCVLVFRKGKVVFTHSIDAAAELVLLLWLVLGIVVLSFMPQASPGSVTLCLIPAILLALRGLDVLVQTKARSRSGAVMMILIPVLTVWSIAQPLRAGLGDLLHLQFNASAMVFATLSLLSLIYALRLRMEKRLQLVIQLHRFCLNILPVLLVIRIAAFNFWSIDDGRRGAQRTGAWLRDAGVHDFIVLVHEDTPADSLSSQLSWYTHGWAGYENKSPWHPDFHTHLLRLPSGRSDSTLIESLDSAHVPIVYVRPADDSLSAREQRQLQRLQRIRLQTPAYTLFSRRSYSGTIEGIDTDL